jgi:TolB protein
MYVYLVSPEGDRYLIASEPDTVSLAGWSGDGKRAVLTSFGSREKISLSELNLSTGTTYDTFRPHQSNAVLFASVSYSRPTGQRLLITSQVNNYTQLLQRYSLSGSLLQTYPHTFSQVGKFTGHFAESPDGTQLALGTTNGMALVNNGGTVARQYHIPGVQSCTPTRWWAPRIVLASCIRQTPRSFAQRLWEIHLDTGAAAALTATPTGMDLGDLNGWAIGHNVYVQSAVGCGAGYLGRLLPNHHTAFVHVPRVRQGVYVFGATDSQLAIQGFTGCTSGGQSALWFDPATNTSTIVLGPPVTGGNVESAYTYPDPLH